MKSLRNSDEIVWDHESQSGKQHLYNTPFAHSYQYSETLYDVML